MILLIEFKISSQRGIKSGHKNVKNSDDKSSSSRRVVDVEGRGPVPRPVEPAVAQQVQGQEHETHRHLQSPLSCLRKFTNGRREIHREPFVLVDIS